MTTMQLVEQHVIDRRDPRWQAIDAAAWASKNLYNAALYQVRQAYILKGVYLNYPAIEKQFKKHNLLPDQQLPMKVVQQVLMQVDHDWQAYFAALTAWEVSPDKFQAKPRLPGYKHTRTGRNLLVYTTQAVEKRAFKQRGVLIPSGLGIEIQTKQATFDQVRIVPRKTHYVVEVVYTIATSQADVDPDHIASLDLGIDNLATVTSNQPGFLPLLINGRPLKSLNHHYNQERARLTRQLPAHRYTSERLLQLAEKRNRRVDAYLHLASRRLVEMFVLCGIGTVVIGKNDGWKQAINLGKRNNQNFVQIPHARFIDMLTYKCHLLGIQVILTEESYTSKTSFLDLEPVEKRDVYAGKRVKRGLFRASNGGCIHADVNGSYNILRKAIPNAFCNGIGAAVVQPVRVTPA